MTSIAAFRSLFISHRVSNRHQDPPALRYMGIFNGNLRGLLRRIFGVNGPDRESSEKIGDEQFWNLGHIERGTITGLRTFIHQHQRQPTTTASRVMYSQTGKELVDDEEWSSANVTGAPANDIHSPHSHLKRPARTFAFVRSHKPHKIMKRSDDDHHQRNFKILAHRESRRNDKMLNSLESRKHDKMLARHLNSEHDKVIAGPTPGSDDEEAVLPVARRVHDPLDPSANNAIAGRSRPGLESGDWLLDGHENDRMNPKSKITLMSKLQCGGFVFSAGVKAERYKSGQ